MVLYDCNFDAEDIEFSLCDYCKHRHTAGDGGKEPCYSCQPL